MAVCSYYLRGACKYGDRCRNEHPGASGNFSNQSWTSTNNRIAVPYTVETMASDVTVNKDKPLWPLSSYGPAKYEPIVIGGLDESPEELRVKAVRALSAGTTAEYTKYEGERTTAAERMYANARDNVRQVYEQAVKVSIQNQVAGSAFTTSTPSAFGGGTTPSAFGGTTSSAFGKPGFGQPVFGQTGFGATSGTSAFGQGTQGTSAFGAPTQPASAFGQPSQPTSAFGQATQTTSVFGQPTQPSSAFGQPPALGAAAQPASVFGKPSQPTSVFGQPSQSTSAFIQPSQPTSAFGQLPQPTSVFGQPLQPMSAFGQPASAFSQPPQAPSTIGQTSQPAFGQSSLLKPTTGAFSAAGGGGFTAFASQPSAFTSAGVPRTTASGAPASPFGTAPPVQSAFGAPSAPAPAVSQPTPIGTSLFGNTLSAATSASTMLSPGGGAFASPMTITPSNEKPASGAPDFAGAKSMAKMKPGADRYLELLPGNYNEVIPADVKAAFASTKFEWGQIPEWIPPPEVR